MVFSFLLFFLQSLIYEEKKEKTMKKELLALITLAFLVIIIIVDPWKPVFTISDDELRLRNASHTVDSCSDNDLREKEKTIELKGVKYEEGTSSHNMGAVKKVFRVTVTRYNPERSQCDDDFLITADNSEIDLRKLNSGKLKWVAISRDLRAHIPYGSKILVSGEPEIEGVWEVHDTMNPRFNNRIDLLSPSSIRKGKWENVKISLLVQN